MQEHRQIIKRASVGSEDSWKASNTNFEKTLWNCCAILNELFKDEAHLYIVNGP
jgi:hypothetical protein